MKYSEKITFQSEQYCYDVKMKKKRSWWWLLLLLLLPLILYLLHRCDSIIPKTIDPIVFTHPVQIMLSWDNTDDLDLHVQEPNNFEIFFGNSEDSQTMGRLNIDMNAGSLPSSLSPQEHISWPLIEKMLPGIYEVSVCNYNERSPLRNSFQIDIKEGDKVFRFSVNEGIEEQRTVPVVKFKWNKQNVISIISSIVPVYEVPR